MNQNDQQIRDFFQSDNGLGDRNIVKTWVMNKFVNQTTIQLDINQMELEEYAPNAWTRIVSARDINSNRIIRIKIDLSNILLKTKLVPTLILDSLGKVQKVFSFSNNPNSSWNITKILSIGYTDNGKGNIKAMAMPPQIGEVPKLPKQINDISGMFINNNSQIINGLENWDTSNVTNMSSIFENASSYDGGINIKLISYNWNTQKVTNMSSMFEGASQFNDHLSFWDTRNVNDMSSMFEEAKIFNSSFQIFFNIENWNTAKVSNMSSMFKGASEFNQDISFFNISSLTNMSSMFENATNFNQDLSSWIFTTNIENINYDKDASNWTKEKPSFN